MKWIFLVALFCGCKSPVRKINTHKDGLVIQVDGRDISVGEYKIDSCEYIGNLGNDHTACWLSHKGNCQNPIHKNK
jgi:hypothetical protein